MLARAARVGILAALLFLSTMTSTQAQPAPRTPIPGDNANDAVHVKLNGRATITGVEDATLEGSLIEDTTCDPSDFSKNSVWFTFTMPYSGTVTIDTSGTFFNTGVYWVNYNVLVTLYRLDVPLPNHIMCDNDIWPVLSEVPLTAATYRVRIASMNPQTVLAPSQARVSIRVNSFTNMLDDFSFETNALGSPWKRKGDTNPPKIVRTCVGTCDVEFRGIAGGKLLQKVSLPLDHLKIKPGDLLRMSGSFNSTPVSGSNVKLAIKITYNDGTPATKVSTTKQFTNTTSNTWSTIGVFYAEFASKNVKKVIASVQSPTAADIFHVDYLLLAMYAGGIARGDPALLSVPAAGGW
ncbi:MAG: hypothetical protein IPM16_19485 [Chloroflexi bacterium]|nr:hypothetical protein [Chloroflexota bacterium]